MSIIIVAYPDGSKCNDPWPEALELAFHHQGPTLLMSSCLQTCLIETEDSQSKLLSTQVSDQSN